MKQYKVPVVLTAAIAAMRVEQAHRHDPIPDNHIETAFRESYVYRTFLTDEAIACSIQGGVAVLTGTVVDESHRVLAQETMASLPGVIRVDNQLSILPDATTVAGIVADMKSAFTDRWIARKLKLTLLFHSNVSATSTIIEVKDGVVTLTGASTSCAQCDLTSEYAKDIDGVKDVINEMTVIRSPTPPTQTARAKMDDASITAQVRTALLIHRSTCALRAKVEVCNGDVTLTGIAANNAERILVTKLVTSIHGVSVVRNLMTIAGHPAA